MNHDKILILDFGSQVTQLIARRIREASVYCEIHPADVAATFIREFQPKGIVLSGSHMSAYEESTDRAPAAVFELGVPVLGICYGMQTMAQQLGGRVEGGHTREFGHAEVRARGHTRLLDGIEDRRSAEGHGLLNVWMSHGDKVVEMPPGFKLMASTEVCPIAGMADESRRFYARAVPSGGHAHAAGRGDPAPLRARHLRLPRRLDHGRPCRRGGAEDPRRGRQRGSHPRPLGRRRFLGRGSADPPRDRQPAHLCVRRHRAAAAERRPAGRRHVRRSTWG